MKLRIFSIILVIIVIGLIVSNVLFYQRATHPSFYDGFVFTQAQTYDQMKQNIEKVIALPSEEPSVAQIADIELLRTTKPELYSAAQNDDVVFLYSSVMVIYRPESSKVVSVFPLSK